MKKLKFLPTILMLVLCVGVLAIGIYAAGTSTNEIQGTITINAANTEIGIIVYGYNDEGVLDETEPVFEAESVRSGTPLILGEDLEFASDTVNEKSQLNNIDIKFKVEIINKSTSQPLGAYFSNSLVTKPTTELAESPVSLEKSLASNNTNGIVKAMFSDYTQISENGSARLDLTFRLTDFITGDKETVDLESEENKIYLNVEEVNPNLLTVEVGSASQPTVTKAMVTALGNVSKVKVAEGVTTIDTSAFLDNTAITKVIMPSTLTTIRDQAFKGCANLATIIFNSTMDLSKISDRAFEDCTTLGTTEDNCRYLEVNDNPYEILIEVTEPVTSLTVKDGVKMLASGCFYTQSTTYSESDAANLYLPTSLEYISSYIYNKMWNNEQEQIAGMYNCTAINSCDKVFIMHFKSGTNLKSGFSHGNVASLSVGLLDNPSYASYVTLNLRTSPDGEATTQIVAQTFASDTTYYVEVTMV